jgi:hypothetical protein
MSNIDENEIHRRLEALSQIEPGREATDRAIDRVRTILSHEEELRPGTGNKRRASVVGSLLRFAAAAVLLICAGFLAGRMFVPPPVDVERLRADLLDRMNRQWGSVLETRCIQLKDELHRQVRRDLAEFAAQTLAASTTMTDRRLRELIHLIEAARLRDRIRVREALEQIELNRLEDKTELGGALEALVAQAGEVQPRNEN